MAGRLSRLATVIRRRTWSLDHVVGMLRAEPGDQDQVPPWLRVSVSWAHPTRGWRCRGSVERRTEGRIVAFLAARPFRTANAALPRFPFRTGQPALRFSRS